MPPNPTPHGVCDKCDRPVVWGITEKGKRMPLDPEWRPADDTYANVAGYHDDTDTLRVRVLRKGQDPTHREQRMVPHFATCKARNPEPVTRGFEVLEQPANLPAGVVAFPNAAQRAARRAGRKASS